MPRDPMSTIRMIGSTLLKLPLFEQFNISNIAEKSSIHWKTTERFLELIHFVQQRLPLVEIKQIDRTKTVSVVRMPLIMKYPPEIQLMIRWYLLGSVSPTTATPIERLYLFDDEKQILDKLINAGYLSISPEGYYVTPLGVSVILRDVGEFYEKFGEKVPVIEEEEPAKEEPIIINGSVSISGIRARCLFLPVPEPTEATAESEE